MHPTGRVDDVINVSGHRIGTAEVESALVNHPACAEAAVVPVEHPIKGQGIYAFVTLMEVCDKIAGPGFMSLVNLSILLPLNANAARRLVTATTYPAVHIDIEHHHSVVVVKDFTGDCVLAPDSSATVSSVSEQTCFEHV